MSELAVHWIIAYVGSLSSGPGPWLWQCVTEEVELGTIDRVIQKFEREKYSADVEYFTVGKVTVNAGVQWIGNYKFTTSVRHHEKLG